jgi:Family of unknown function (DUF6176)
MPYSVRKIYVSCDRSVIDQWANFVVTHEEEGRISLFNEGVRHEMWWTGGDEEGLFLVCAIDVDDMKRAQEAFATSTLDVDQFHRRFKTYWTRSVDLETPSGGTPAFPSYELLVELRPAKDRG